jgi:hypothetical protein
MFKAIDPKGASAAAATETWGGASPVYFDTR